MEPIWCSSIARIEKQDDIGYIIIENGAANKIDETEFISLSLFKEWLKEHPLKGLIITGKGRNFSSGANVGYINKMKENPKQLEEELNKGKEVLNFIEKLPIVTVAAISGACFGAGFEIALSCQYRICSKNAMFSFPEIGLGFIPGFGGTVRLSEIVGKRKAQEIILTGNVILAEEAKQLNIVDEISDKGKHIEEAEKLIKRLTEHVAFNQLNNAIELINSSNTFSRDERMEKESYFFASLAHEKLTE